MYGKQDYGSAKKNWDAFWNKEFIGRPILSLTSPKDGAPALDLRAQSYVNRVNDVREGNFYALLEDFDKLAGCVNYAAESLPFYTCDFAPDIFAAFYGGKIVAQKGEYTTWVHPVSKGAAGFYPELDTSEGSTFSLFKKYFEIASEYAKDRFFVAVPDLHSNMDALSCMLTPETLCIELMDNPEEVRRLMSVVEGDYRFIYDTFYKSGKMDQKGCIGWAPTYLPQGKFAVVQCDFSCMVSPEMARSFIIPAIEREADFLDRCVYHYDGKGALGHVDDILAIKGIDCVQWVPGDGQPRSIEWMELLKKIQKAGKSLWIYDWTAEEILADKELDPSRVVFSLGLGSQKECDVFIKSLEKKYGG